MPAVKCSKVATACLRQVSEGQRTCEEAFLCRGTTLGLAVLAAGRFLCCAVGVFVAAEEEEEEDSEELEIVSRFSRGRGLGLMNVTHPVFCSTLSSTFINDGFKLT